MSSYSSYGNLIIRKYLSQVLSLGDTSKVFRHLNFSKISDLTKKELHYTHANTHTYWPFVIHLEQIPRYRDDRDSCGELIQGVILFSDDGETTIRKQNKTQKQKICPLTLTLHSISVSLQFRVILITNH